MRYVLYDILFHLAFVILLPFFVLRMVTVRKYREGIPERFGFIGRAKLAALKGGTTVWVHAVSVGETKAVMPVLRSIKERRPGLKIVFSTVTQTGNRTAAAEGRGLIDALIYCPIDFSWAVRRVAGLMDPKAFIVVEKEVWPNIFRVMGERGAPVIVVNGTISDRSFRRFEKLGFFFKDVFSSVSFFCARTEADRNRAVRLGVAEGRAAAFGNVKFDLKPKSVDNAYTEGLKRALGIRAGERVIVAGSTHSGEEEIVLEAFKRLKGEFPTARLVIAPRHPERFQEVESLIRKSGLSYSRRSTGGAGDVMMLDTVGELMTVYSFADVALVAGSFVPGIGGHNLLEPAFFGKPVLYGSHLTAYASMADMLEGGGGGMRVPDNGLYDSLKKLLSDEGLRKTMGERGRKVVEENTGAAQRTAVTIERFLP